MHTKANPLFALLAFLFLLACDSRETGKEPVILSGLTMGTSYTVRINAPVNEETSSSIQKAIEEKLNDINEGMSTYLPESELSRINRAPTGDWLGLSDPLYEVLRAAFEVNYQSLGYFDITVGPLVNLWGFGPEEKSPAIPDPETIDRMLQSVGMDKLMLDTNNKRLRKTSGGTFIDLSGIAKGYAVDTLGKLLADRFGLTHFLVEIGGEITARGNNPENTPWQIGVETPDTLSRTVSSIVALENQSLASSGDYRNFFEIDGKRYSHTINPSSGWPVKHELVAVTVIHKQCMVADAWATAFLAAGPDMGMQMANSYGLEALFTLREDDEYKRIFSRAYRERQSAE